MDSREARWPFASRCDLHRFDGSQYSMAGERSALTPIVGRSLTSITNRNPSVPWRPFSGDLTTACGTDRAPNHQMCGAAWMSSSKGRMQRAHPFDVATTQTGRCRSLQHPVNVFERAGAGYRSVHTNFLAIRSIGCRQGAAAMPVLH